VDREFCWVSLKAQEVNPTPKAAGLLETMMTHPDEVLTRDRLLGTAWGWDYSSLALKDSFRASPAPGSVTTR
jgi:DNA-binding response OmpR family regulator